MKRFVLFSTMAIVGMLLLSVFPRSVSGQDGVVAIYTGRGTAIPSCEGASCTGDLVTCPPGAFRVTAKEVFQYAVGMCDDNNEASACAGRLTALYETCPQPWTVVGTMFAAQRDQGKFRLCFDENAVSDCTDPLPENVLVVYEADVRTQSSHVVLPWLTTPAGNPVRGHQQGNIEFSPTATTPFTIDGNTVQLPPIVAVSHFMLQTDSDGDNCEAINALMDQPPGCGMSGVIIAPQAPAGGCCCADCDGNGAVEVNELVTGVNNALGGCPQ